MPWIPDREKYEARILVGILGFKDTVVDVIYASSYTA